MLMDVGFMDIGPPRMGPISRACMFCFWPPPGPAPLSFPFWPRLALFSLGNLALHLLTILIWNQNRTPSSVWIKLSFLHTIFTYAFLKKKKKTNQHYLPVSKTQKHADYIYQYHPNCFFSLNSQHSFIISRFVGHKKVSALTIVGLFYSYSFSYIVDCGLSNSTSFSTFPLQRWITTKGRTSQLKNHICLKKIKIVKRPDMHCYHHRGNHLHNATIFQGYETNP